METTTIKPIKPSRGPYRQYKNEVSSHLINISVDSEQVPHVVMCMFFDNLFNDVTMDRNILNPSKKLKRLINTRTSLIERLIESSSQKTIKTPEHFQVIEKHFQILRKCYIEDRRYPTHYKARVISTLSALEHILTLVKKMLPDVITYLSYVNPIPEYPFRRSITLYSRPTHTTIFSYKSLIQPDPVVDLDWTITDLINRIILKK